MGLLLGNLVLNLSACSLFADGEEDYGGPDQEERASRHPAQAGHTDSPPTWGDLRYGMSRESVEDLMGPPDIKETAGKRTAGNERWTYRDSTGTLSKPQQTLIFEAGRLTSVRRPAVVAE